MKKAAPKKPKKPRRDFHPADLLVMGPGEREFARQIVEQVEKDGREATVGTLVVRKAEAHRLPDAWIELLRSARGRIVEPFDWDRRLLVWYVTAHKWCERVVDHYQHFVRHDESEAVGADISRKLGAQRARVIDLANRMLAGEPGLTPEALRGRLRSQLPDIDRTTIWRAVKKMLQL